MAAPSAPLCDGYDTPTRTDMKDLVTFKKLVELALQTSSGSGLYALLTITGSAQSRHGDHRRDLGFQAVGIERA